jgi:hypothetical protein
VQQLLTFARRQVSRPQTVNLNKCLSDLEPLLVQTIGERVECGLALSPVLEPVRLDPAQFEAAILNLVINARDAMSPGGRIEVVTENVDLANGFDELAPGPHVLVSVRDTGAGMAPDVVAKAIHPFFTTKPAGTGTGLGLSQVFGFVKSFGGSLRIDSAVGRSTTILLYFPKGAQPLETAWDDRLPLRPATPDGRGRAGSARGGGRGPAQARLDGRVGRRGGAGGAAWRPADTVMPGGKERRATRCRGAATAARLEGPADIGPSQGQRRRSGNSRRHAIADQTLPPRTARRAAAHRQRIGCVLGSTSGEFQGFQRRKLAISRRPVAWLFSGWNCVPARLSRPTMAVTGPP